MSETSNMLLIIVYSFGWFWRLEKRQKTLPNRPCIFASKLFCWRVSPYKAQSMKWKVPCIKHFTVRLLFFCIYLYMGKTWKHRTMLVHSKQHSESLNPIDINFELPKNCHRTGTVVDNWLPGMLQFFMPQDWCTVHVSRSFDYSRWHKCFGILQGCISI